MNCWPKEMAAGLRNDLRQGRDIALGKSPGIERSYRPSIDRHVDAAPSQISQGPVDKLIYPDKSIRAGRLVDRDDPQIHQGLVDQLPAGPGGRRDSGRRGSCALEPDLGERVLALLRLLLVGIGIGAKVIGDVPCQNASQGHEWPIGYAAGIDVGGNADVYGGQARSRVSADKIEFEEPFYSRLDQSVDQLNVARARRVIDIQPV